MKKECIVTVMCCSLVLYTDVVLRGGRYGTAKRY